MGQLNNLPENAGSDDPRAAETILRAVTQDLRSLQQDLVVQLNQDVKRLHAEKSRLLSDIQKLQAQHQALQSKQQTALSQQQLAQQQAWAKQLAQALATHLQAQLVQRLQTPNPQRGDAMPASTANGYNENASRLLASLDSTLNRTLSSVRQDLNSYQSSLSQQINRMQNLEQQGEAILEALVSRLSQQLRAEAVRTPIGSQAQSNGYASVAADHSLDAQSRLRPSTILPVAPVVAPEPTIAPIRPTRSLNLSQFQTGWMLILLSTVALSLHNVIVGILANLSSIFGVYELGGFISLNTGNALLILWMRMLVVVPLMAVLAGFLYPPVWRDIKAFSLSRDRRLLRSVVGSGFFLFLSQVLIYIAIGEVGPGVAVTILFMYPIVTVPLAWVLFGDRPTSLRWIVMGTILLGVVLTTFPKLAASTDISWQGVGTAVFSGIAFAFYLISMQISFRKLHPVPVSLIQFVTIFLLTSLSLIFLPLEVEVPPAGRTGLVIGGVVLGTLTLIGYLLNNFGVRFIGAARASIIAAAGPALTALLAFVIAPGARNNLQIIQVGGIVIVTLAVIALSYERKLMQDRAAKAAK